ncbi:MAG: DMT family transporter [Clostridiales bacterium]|nr:DMT family transporter [Clostridiales bacterium]
MLRRATWYAVLAALLYAANLPFAKVLLQGAGPLMLAALLYLGAGLGMAGVRLMPAMRQQDGPPLSRRDLPYVIGMVVLDIAAPILMLLGLQTTDPRSASLLNSFEIVATSLIALLAFGEKISPRLWRAIGLMTAASMLLSVQAGEGLRLSVGSLLIVLASICWGLENNCTRMISHKSGGQIVIIKGLGAGAGALAIALAAGEGLPPWPLVLAGLMLGFVSYGLSILLYVRAQRDLGAAKTSAWYALAPYLGVILSALLFRTWPGWNFYAALGIMLGATALIIRDTIGLQHTHEHAHTHSHPHPHGDLMHEHEHMHRHIHLHAHADNPQLHDHAHDALEDEHRHTHPA